MYFFFVNFLLPPILEVDISDLAIISGITNMVKTIILVINNTPQKTYRIAQYTDSWNRLDPLKSGLRIQPASGESDQWSLYGSYCSYRRLIVTVQFQRSRSFVLSVLPESYLRSEQSNIGNERTLSRTTNHELRTVTRTLRFNTVFVWLKSVTGK